MKIKITQSVELEVFQPFDGTSINKIFKKGTVIEATVSDVLTQFGTCTVQFNDGSIVYGVPLMVIEVID
jgi:hypothetical protein